MKLRGAGLKSLLVSIERLHGTRALEAVKAAVPERIRAEIEGTILPVQWYPVEVPAHVHAAVRDVIGGGTWDVSHALGVEGARVDFGGMYRVLVRSMPYDSIWDRAQRAWRHYNSQGDARWIERTGSTAIGVINGVGGFNTGLWYSIAGRVEAMLGLAGVKSASAVVTECSPTSARIEAIWVP